MANSLTRPAPARQDAPFREPGRNERRDETYFLPYVESLSDARTKLTAFFTILPCASRKNPRNLPRSGRPCTSSATGERGQCPRSWRSGMTGRMAGH